MLDLHTHKNQLQAHPNDHKKDLMNLALKLHELQTEMSNNIQYISEHKYICSILKLNTLCMLWNKCGLTF